MERGEVYYLRFDGGLGSEMATGRPVVVVSSQRMINIAPTVTIVYLTTSPKQFEDKVELTTPQRQSWARCDQIYTIDKSRLSNVMCKLTDWEMDDIDKKIMEVLGLQQSVEVQEVIEQVNVGTSDMALRVELDTYKKLYADLIKQITDARFERQVVVEEADIVEEPQPNIELDEQPKKKTGRPKGSKNKPKKIPVGSKVTSEDLAGFKKTGKVNINEDSWEVIAATTGMSPSTAQEIVRYRNRNNGFADLTELLFVPRFGNGCMNKYGYMLEA